MKSYKVISLGLLICLVCLYLMNDLWGIYGYTVGGYVFPIGTIIAINGILRKINKPWIYVTMDIV